MTTKEKIYQFPATKGNLEILSKIEELLESHENLIREECAKIVENTVFEIKDEKVYNMIELLLTRLAKAIRGEK